MWAKHWQGRCFSEFGGKTCEPKLSYLTCYRAILFITIAIRSHSTCKPSVSLSEVDRRLLDQCLEQAPRAWENFVDRFLGLVVHVVNHTAQTRQIQLQPEQRDDLVADVFMALVDNQFAVLRRFRRNCSLATYLAVVARRIIVRRMLAAGFQMIAGAESFDPAIEATHENRIADQEQVEQMMARLDPKEANVVRMFHLEGKSYGEISAAAGLPENSVGPMLSRARAKLRDDA